jgi:hypothetical protein
MSDKNDPLAGQAQPKALDAGTVNTDHLPPQRPRKRVSKQVRPPLEGMSLTTFIYGLVALAALYLGGQSLLTAQWSILGNSGTSKTASAVIQGQDAIKDKIHSIATGNVASGAAAAQVRFLP